MPPQTDREIIMAYIGALANARYSAEAGKVWDGSVKNYVPIIPQGELQNSLSRIVRKLQIESLPNRASEVNRDAKRAAEWINLTALKGRGLGTPLYSKAGLSSENFMARYDSYWGREADESVTSFIKRWRRIIEVSQYILSVADSGPKVVVPKDRFGRPMGRVAFDRMMKKDLHKLSKRDRLDYISRAMYDLNPDNKPGIMTDMVVSMLDPRGPWGYAGKNAEGEMINNWQAFKDSVNDLEQAEGAGEFALGFLFVGLSGLGLIPALPSPSKAGGVAARSSRAAAKHTALDLNREAGKIANKAKAAAKSPKSKMTSVEKSRVSTKADELLAVTKHNDEIIKKYGKQGCCIKKGINESVRILEQQIFCVPYQVDADGKIIDPVTNGGAYNLQPGDYILGPSNKKGKRNHFTVERTPTNTSRAIVYNAKKFAGATVRTIKNNRQFALWRRDAKVGDRFTITYVMDTEMAQYAKGAIRGSDGRPLVFGDEIADVAFVNPDMFGDFTKAKIQNVEMVEITFTVKDGAKFDRPGTGGTTMSQNPYAGGAWYTSSGKGAMENPRTGAIEVDSHPQGLGVVHVDVSIPPKTFGEPDLQKVHNAITDRMNHEIRHAADPGGGGVPVTAGEIRKQGKFIVDDDYVVLDLADEAVIYMNELPSWRRLNEPWDVRYRLSPNEINAFVSEIYRSIPFTNKQIKQAARKAGKKPKKITFEELVDEQLDQVVKRADKQTRQRQGNFTPEQYQQLVQMDIPKVKEAWMDHAKKFFPCALLRNGQKINPGACKRTVKEYIERVVLEELEKTLQDYQNN